MWKDTDEKVQTGAPHEDYDYDNDNCSRNNNDNDNNVNDNNKNNNDNNNNVNDNNNDNNDDNNKVQSGAAHEDPPGEARVQVRRMWKRLCRLKRSEQVQAQWKEKWQDTKC